MRITSRYSFLRTILMTEIAQTESIVNKTLQKCVADVIQFQCFYVTTDPIEVITEPDIYIAYSAPNNSNETYTFMRLGRGGRFGQC